MIASKYELDQKQFAVFTCEKLSHEAFKEDKTKMM